MSSESGVPEAGEGKRGPDGHLPYLLRQAQAAVRARMEQVLSDLAVTPPQFAVLTMVDAYPGLSGADLARLTLLTPQTVGGIVKNLMRDGALERAPHPTHGRIQVLALTPKGVRLLSGCKARIRSVDEAMRAGLAPGEEVVIRRWLAGLASRSAEGSVPVDDVAGRDVAGV